MADRPILFSGPMVRAILDGRKTQTRRVLQTQPPKWVNFCEQPLSFNALQQWVPSGLWRWAELNPTKTRALRQWPLDAEGQHYWLRPRCSIGDRLWVRETWSHTGDGVFEIRQARIAPTGRVIYAATPAPDAPHAKYWPSIHMPREFSRLTLKVTDVRLQRLWDISPEDAKAEGAEALTDNPFGRERDALPSYRWGFAALWASINGASSWIENPWVAALTFTVAKANVDALPSREAA